MVAASVGHYEAEGTEEIRAPCRYRTPHARGDDVSTDDTELKRWREEGDGKHLATKGLLICHTLQLCSFAAWTLTVRLPDGSDSRQPANLQRTGTSWQCLDLYVRAKALHASDTVRERRLTNSLHSLSASAE